MVKPTLDLETSHWNQNKKYICGIDEVGRGSWAGPLVVAGVILPQDFKIPKFLADSKLVTAKRRVELSKHIQKTAVGFHIAAISPKQIDKFGLGNVTQIAFRQVARNIRPIPHHFLIDAFYIRHFNRKKQSAVKNGDKICASIAAASIIAKVYRDELMVNLSKKFPKYFFDKNKGYGTKIHQEAISQFGLSSIHRRSYKIDFLFE